MLSSCTCKLRQRHLLDWWGLRRPWPPGAPTQRSLSQRCFLSLRPPSWLTGDCGYPPSPPDTRDSSTLGVALLSLRPGLAGLSIRRSKRAGSSLFIVSQSESRGRQIFAWKKTISQISRKITQLMRTNFRRKKGEKIQFHKKNYFLYWVQVFRPWHKNCLPSSLLQFHIYIQKRRKTNFPDYFYLTIVFGH